MALEDDRPAEIGKTPGSPSGKRKIRVRIFIFMVCLAISASMWVFIELMKDYTTDVTYAIIFKNVPEDLILVNQDDSTLTLGITAQGFELFVTQYLRKQQVLELDLKDLRISQGAEGYTAFLPSSRLVEQIGRQLPYSRAITSVRPDTLMFRFSEIYRRQVPVKADISLSFANEYQLYDSLRVIPDRIVVSSIKDVIDTLRFITTRHLELNHLDSNVSMMVPLHKSLRNNMMRYSSDSVQLRFRVQKYTEAVFTIPVNITGNSLPVRIFPNQVEISCQVPLSEYKDLKAEDFEAYVTATPALLESGKHLAVKAGRIPANARNVRMKPDKVEYIIISR